MNVNIRNRRNKRMGKSEEAIVNEERTKYFILKIMYILKKRNPFKKEYQLDISFS